MAATLAAATQPSWLWFTTRAAGTVAILLLTLATVLGISTARRWDRPEMPGFALALLHRNASLMAVVFVAVHVVTAIADPFALLHPIDAAIPFSGIYRTDWLALGVIAFDLLLAVSITSLLRRFIGHELWKAIHWCAYACWPLAVVHGLGTGSDGAQPWMIGITATCISAVVIAVFNRLIRGHWRTLPFRFLLGGLAGVSAAAIALWGLRYPLQPGWVVTSGTPAQLLRGSTPTPLPARPQGFSDPVAGTMTQTAAGTYFSLRDQTDTQLTITVSPAPPGQSLPMVKVQRDSHTVCNSPARASETLYFVCGGSRVILQLEQSGRQVLGRLDSSGDLR